MGNQSRIKLYDDLLVLLSDFMCVVKAEDINTIRSIMTLVTDYKVISCK